MREVIDQIRERQQPGFASAGQSKLASFIQDGSVLSIKSEEMK